MASDEDPIYCLCRLPYDETRFMIECDVCKDWFHGSCVGVQEHQATDIEIYHCPNCTPKHGPLVLKHKRNWHKQDCYEDGSKINPAVKTGTVVFIKELKSRTFLSAEKIPIKRLHGSQLVPQYFEEEGFDVPILCEKKDGLGLTLPPPSISIQEIEHLVGPMREIDVIDVARQDDIKMIMREWTEYYNSPNREKILNVISLEFSNTALSEYVVPPNIIRQLSWARNYWPEQLPDDSSLARPEVQKYCLMGVKDSFTDFHIDFGGTSVWYHVLRGEKVFYLIRPTPSNLMLYEHWLTSSNQSEMFFGDKVDKCYRMVVKEGHTLFIPTGWIHAVLTPLDSLVFGGNFLHNFNIALQLKCYEIERAVKTPDKYLFPSYETINWYAAKNILDILKDDTEEGKTPPHYLTEGARALSTSLKLWTQRKDLQSQSQQFETLTSKYVYAKVGKQDVADYIQYGKLLKELQKEVKKIDGMLKKTSPKKQDQRQKRVEKLQKGFKKSTSLDILESHTKDVLKAAERERREKMYNFEEEEEGENSVSLKVRIPKAGAYLADSEEKELKTMGDKENAESRLVSAKGKAKEETDSKHVIQEKAKKGGRKKEEKTVETKDVTKVDILKTDKSPVKVDILKTDKSPVKVDILKTDKSPVKEVPQCLKFKLSNGKMVSTDRKTKGKKLKKKEFLLLGPDLSKSVKEEITAVDNEDVNLKDNQQKKQDVHVKDYHLKKQDVHVKDPQKKQEEKASHKPSKVRKCQSGEGEKKASQAPPVSKKDVNRERRRRSPAVKKSRPELKSKPTLTPALVAPGKDSDSDSDQLVVDEHPQKSRDQKTTSTTKPASLKLKLLPGADDRKLGGAGEKMEPDSVPGGLNGSITDLLTASGYSGESTFKGDTDANGMRDAIAGMLTMSRLGDGELSHGSYFQEASPHKKPSAAEEEEQLMADCYRDAEFVYPSFELSDDEEESVQKGKKKSEKDDNWNPKARVDCGLVKVEREQRVGVQKESLASSLAATAAKLAENPPNEKKHVKKACKPKVPEKLDFEVEPLPGPSSALDGPVSGNAFRPGIKRPVDPCAGASSQPAKSKKPKKGLATPKQRLGKLLKIKKMVF